MSLLDGFRQFDPDPSKPEDFGPFLGIVHALGLRQALKRLGPILIGCDFHWELLLKFPSAKPLTRKMVGRRDRFRKKRVATGPIVAPKSGYSRGRFQRQMPAYIRLRQCLFRRGVDSQCESHGTMTPGLSNCAMAAKANLACGYSRHAWMAAHD